MRNGVVRALLILSLATVPAAAGDGTYLDIFVGTNDTDDTTFDIAGGSSIETTFDGGFTYGVAFGYRFDGFRIEGELSQRDADVDTHALDGGAPLVGATGEGKARSLMGNVFYDFRKGETIEPYVGVGVGLSQVSFDNFGVTAIPDVLDDDDTSLVYQAIAGLGIGLNDTVGLRFDVRYFDAPDVTFTTSAATGGVSTDADYSTLDFTAGVRILF